MIPGSYERWITQYDTLTPAARAALVAEELRLTRRPVFSILLPVYNPHLEWLQQAIDSVKAQTWSRWELCIADDASTEPGVRPFLKAQAQSDARIKLVFRAANGHISACSNSALALARGEWCALLDQDDVLAPHALSLVAREINAFPNAGLIYSDEDFLEPSGARLNPFLKPDWNAELFLAQNYLNHLGVYRADLLRGIGGFREGFEGSQDYDLALRCIERLQPEQIRHVPRVLYHWRMVPGSLAEVRDAKPYAKDAARRALREHLERRGIIACVEPCPESPESHRVRFSASAASHEVLVCDGGAAALNEAANTSRADVMIFVGAQIEIDDASVAEMVSQAQRRELGAVGARVWSSAGTLVSGGIVLGLGGLWSEAHAGVPRGHAGFFNSTILQRNCCAVSATCLAVRREVFRELGGFDESNLKRRYHDVDFCLRARERGLQIVWTPYANLIALNQLGSEPSPEDERYMRSRWGTQLTSDPFYNPALSLELPGFELSFPPRWSERHRILPRSTPNTLSRGS
ncbi:MAG TPA: glycosyltransferase [Chthoniobacterales bacterium]|nr:glycosyltransferase [Chthoniobacterales bacterium]